MSSKSFSELTDDELIDMHLKIKANARCLDVERERPAAHSEYGLCANCVYFSLTKSEFYTIWALCSAYRVLAHLDPRNPVIECTAYEKIG